MKALLLILLLTSLNCFAIPPDWANNPDADDMPDEANCSFCEEEAPIDVDNKSLILGAFLTAFVMSIYKPKKQSDG